MSNKYTGPVPKHCDLCNIPLGSVFVDGRTKQGPWANMCSSCHEMHGVGLGEGKGQRWYCHADEGWVKRNPDPPKPKYVHPVFRD